MLQSINTKKGTGMNANDLADELDIHVSMGNSKFFKECADMLRQQQAEIESLKAGGEPVAWTNADCLEMVKEDGESNMWWMPDLAEDIPLYTHPAKTLTDEKILKTCIKFGFYDRISDPHFDEKTGAWSLDEDLIEFARAILRKAQEKC